MIQSFGFEFAHANLLTSDLRYLLTTTDLTALVMAVDCPPRTMSYSADSVEEALGGSPPQGQLVTLDKTQNRMPVPCPATLRNASSHNGHRGCRQSILHSSLQLARSDGDGHESTVSANDERGSRKSAEDADEGKRFEVKWDGESDPENPRMMNQARKWLIVIIACTSSTCVCGKWSHSRRGGF